jgi:hypothetical protein
MSHIRRFACVWFVLSFSLGVMSAKKDVSAYLKQGAHVYVCVTSPKDFMDTTHTSTFDRAFSFSPMGVGSAVGKGRAKGEELRQSEALQDPSAAFRDELIAYVSSKYPAVLCDSADNCDKQAHKGDANDGLLFQLRTIQWGLYCCPNDCKHARVVVDIQLKVYGDHGAKLASLDYKVFLGDRGPRLLPSDYYKDDGRLIKEQLAEAARQILHEMIEELAL